MANKHLFNKGKLQAADAKNQAGGKAYALAPEHALAQLAVTGTLHATYYTTAEAQLEQVREVADRCAPEFVAKAAQGWIAAVGAKAAYIAPDSPWENGYVESFNARLRDELLDGKIFYSLREAEVVIESWRRHFNAVRPHGALGYRPPAPEVVLPSFLAWPLALRRPTPSTMQTVAPRPTLN